MALAFAHLWKVSSDEAAGIGGDKGVKFNRRLFGLLLLLVPLLCARTPLTHEAVWLMKRVGAPVPSPDGKPQRTMQWWIGTEATALEGESILWLVDQYGRKEMFYPQR